MSKGLDIVIVNWNSGRQLLRCLESISTFLPDELPLTLIVVDNASVDDSLNDIEKIGLPLTVIRNQVNRGFAAACNQGAALCDSNYLLFLNPDTCLNQDSLVIPMAFMEEPQNSNIGICGIQLLDEIGQVARSCARFPTPVMFATQIFGLNKLSWLRLKCLHMTDWDHSATQTVDHVIGAFFLVRRSVFNCLNGFDERFFVYLEDLDFSLRTRQAGWLTVYLKEARAFHAGGGTTRQIKATRLFYSLRSRLLYGFKHFNPIHAWLLLTLTIAVEPVARLSLALKKKSWSECTAIIPCYLLLLKNIPRMLLLQRK